ncbi:MAG: metallophosphoesterase family protein, partial [Planctomycetota bacterium]
MTDPRTEDPLVGPYLSNPGTTCMTVAWIRGDDAECVLRLDAEEASAREFAVQPRRAIEGSTDHFYELRLEDLEPGRRYAYSLRCPRGEHTASLTTLPRDPESFDFIYYGDNKSAAGTHRKVGLLFDRHAPLFALHSGDMTDHGAYEEYKTYFFDPIRDVVDHIPLLVGRGNHEGDGKAYRQVFPLPEGDTWYSFDCGPAHFIVLDTTGWRHAWEKDDVRRMYEWLEADLDAARDAAWKIAMYHEPSYDLGWRKDDW